MSNSFYFSARFIAGFFGWFCLTFVAAGLVSSVHGAEPDVLPKGYLVGQSDFEGANALQGWQGQATLGPGYHSTQSLAVAQGIEKSNRSPLVQFKLPVEKIRGCTIRGTAMVRAEKVSAKPNNWNGIKFMLAIDAPAGKSWPQAPIETGTFDWKRVACTARIPTDATSVSLTLGLEQVTGQVWFDDLKIVVAKVPIAVQAPVNAGPRYKGHDLPRLRGAMISPGLTAESLRVLGQDWHANLIRWQLIRHGRPGQLMPLDDYDAWLEGELKKLDAALPHCASNGLYVVVDLHSPPGGKPTVSGYVGSDSGLFTDRRCQDKFLEVWRRIALRYQKAAPIWGYDLANEPVEDDVEEGCYDWPELAERTAKAIRIIDPQRAIIVEPAPWGGPDGLKDFAPLPVSNLVYSVHMYIPHAFTHQGVNNQGPAYRYPGMVAGKMWDRSQLEAALQPVIQFQQRYNAHIYIGEFSAIRWAPDQSAYRYLKDLIDIFEAHEWDWSYHAFREWQGWSVEHGPDRADSRPVPSPTERQLLLRDWFSRNQKRAWQSSKSSK